MVRRCQPSETRAVVQWLKERHYLRSAPPGFIHVLEVMEGRERIGAMILGGGARVGRGSHLGINARLPGGRGSQKLGVARLVALMRKHVRTWLPGIRLLLAYSDGAAGHPCGATFYEDPHFFLHRACIPLADVDFMAQTTMFSQRGCTTGRFT